MFKIRLIISVLLFLGIINPCYGAIVDGTNAGFVTTAPTANPSQAQNTILDNRCRAAKFVSPSDADTITSMGWWCENGTAETLTFYWGLYDHDSGNNRPGNLLQSANNSQTSTSNTWINKTGLNWDIDPSTTYWLVVNVSLAASDHTNIGYDTSAVYEYTRKDTSILPNPYGVPDGTGTALFAIYALYTTAARPQLIMITE